MNKPHRGVHCNYCATIFDVVLALICCQVSVLIGVGPFQYGVLRKHDLIQIDYWHVAPLAVGQLIYDPSAVLFKVSLLLCRHGFFYMNSLILNPVLFVKPVQPNRRNYFTGECVAEHSYSFFDCKPSPLLEGRIGS